jgi:riboflavin kinase/FMN adenylyltransferase
LRKLCCTVGKFNSFHRGHQRLIDEARKRCKEILVISIRGKGEELFSEREREELARRFSVKLLNLSFDSIKELSPREFFSFLKELGCELLVVGKDWRFGKGRRAGVREAEEIGRELSIEVVPVEFERVKGEKVSTSRIVKLLKEGKVKEANELLGFPYFVIGRVERGREVGRKLGFPTVNLSFDRELPLRRGVYLVRLSFNGESYEGLANYGVRPTFSLSSPVLEVFVPGKELPPLYGREVKVEFLDFLRDERKFSGVEELKKQIKLDLRKFKTLLEEGVGNSADGK